MLARSPIEILGDTEIFLAERVGLLDGAVHPSESRASLRPARAIAGGANIAKISGGSRVKGDRALWLEEKRPVRL